MNWPAILAPLLALNFLVTLLVICCATALLAIGMSGQGTLDKVAGPVGEALIMTALGLAVAIPAVLAYNAFSRSNRLLLTELDGFAHDLFAYMSTGNRSAAEMPSKTRVSDLRPVAEAA